MIFESSTYVGNGTSQTVNLSTITGTPNFVWTEDQTLDRNTQYRMTGMSNSQRIIHAATSTTAITALNAGSFDVGADLDANQSGSTFGYIAIYDDGAGDFTVGSYTGDGTASQSKATGLANLECVWVFENAATTAYWHSLSMGGATDSSAYFGSGAPAAGYITDISTTAGTFVVGTNLNTSGTTYYFVAFGPVSGFIDSVSYTGNSTDNTNVDVDPNNQGNTPDFALIDCSTTAHSTYWRAEGANTGDASQTVLGVPSVDRIQGFSSETVQVGGNANVNNTGDTYHCFWLKSNPTSSSIALFSNHLIALNNG